MIDANELLVVMNILGSSITDREAKEMIEFADHDKGIKSIIFRVSYLIFSRFFIIFR